MKPEKIIVGLGNPGNKYRGTRHNIGYMVLSELASRHARGRVRNQFQGDVFDAEINGTPVLLLCPTTFMNLSGQSVSAALRYYKLSPSQLLVVCDDLDLPVAKIRLRKSGGSGGQKGLQDIISRIGINDFARLRIGIGRPPEHWEAADYVLSPFRKEERNDIELSLKTAADAAEHWVAEGCEATMNRYN